MRVTIDRDGCISCGACWSACPEVFEENDADGLSQIVEAHRIAGSNAEGEIPADLEDCAKDGAESCPVEVIHAV